MIDTEKKMIADNMSTLSKYHEAVKSLIQSVFSGTVVYEPVNNAFEYAFKQTGGDVKFPLISLYASPSIELDKKNINFANYKDGFALQPELLLTDKNGANPKINKKLAKNVKVLYMKVGYQIEVWSTDRQSAEQAMTELVFWLYDNQTVTINYMGVPLDFTFEMGSEIIDNSDLTLYHTDGKLYRYTIDVIVSGLLMQSENYFNVLKSDIELEVIDE